MNFVKDYIRALSSEVLKMKRTLALWLVVIAPLSVILLQFMVVVRPSFSSHRIRSSRSSSISKRAELRETSRLLFSLRKTSARSSQTVSPRTTSLPNSSNSFTHAPKAVPFSSKTCCDICARATTSSR